MRSEYLPFGKPNFSNLEIEAVSRAMHSGWIGMGPETIAFEQELERYLDVPHVVTVNSCTSALFLSLIVSGVVADDEVICPSLTWCSTANVALNIGAKVVFCDIDPETLCVTVDSILDKVTSKTRAVMVVHMGGLAVDIAALREKIPAHIEIIEDAAHALGAKYPDGSPVGSAGNLTCFSFYANKNLSTGEGGAIALHDKNKAERLRTLRQHGLTADAWKRFSHPQAALTPALIELGYKMNYSDLQACIGRVQLRRQQEFYIIRREIAKLYLERLAITGIKFKCQYGLESESHARHLFVVRLPVDDMVLSRNELVLELRAKNVGASIHYSPLHTMPLYALKNPATMLPNTERVDREIMTLPISASMTLSDANYVIDQLVNIIE